MTKKKKTDEINRRVFITDTGKTIFYSALAASVIPAIFTASCTKGNQAESGTISQNGNLVISEDGLKQACTHGFVCFDEYECGGSGGNGSFNCNHGFQCDEDFECSGPNFHCHDVFTMHEGGAGS